MLPLIGAPAAALAQTAAPAAAADQAAPWLWAAPALYGLERSICAPDPANDPASDQGDRGAGRITAVVAPEFCGDLAPGRRATFGRAFAEAVARHFPQVEQTFGQHLPAGATTRARLRHTLAASLRLSRATFSMVSKGNSVDAYMPVTLTLDVTDLSTGEVVFTRTRSEVPEGVYAPDTAVAELARQFPVRLMAAMEALVADSAAAFRPYAQTATVLGEVSLNSQEKAWVIDRGRKSGLRTGDGIGPDGKVIHAGADYAVVRPALGEYRNGQQLVRTVVAPSEMLARPGTLVVVDSVPDGYAPAWAGQIFEDALGAAGNLSPVPVNFSFLPLRELALSGEEGVLQNDERSLPEYIALLRVALLDPVSYPSNLPGVEIDHFEAHVFASLTDATGRVVGTWHGTGAIDDQISAGVRFPVAQRRDAVLRNALLDAATKMAAYQPQPRFLPVSAAGKGFAIADPAGAVPFGVTLPVLRPLGRFRGLADQVMMRVGEITVRDAAGSVVTADNGGVAALSLRGGEVVALEVAGNPASSRRTIAQCTDPAGLPKVDDRGPVSVALWPIAAEALAASRLNAPVHLATLTARLRPYSASFAGWERFTGGMSRTPDSCFLPVIAVGPAASGYDVLTGFSQWRGEQKIGATGLKATLTPTRLPAATGPQAAHAMLQIDLARQVPPLAQRAAAALAPAP